MRDVEGGDLSRRDPGRDASTRSGRLSQGFNSMLERLSQADAQIRAFNQRLGRRDRGGDARPVGEERDARRSSTGCSTTCASTTRRRCGWRRWASWPRSWRTRSARRCRRCRGTSSWRCCSASCRRRCASGSTSRRARSSASARSCATTSTRRGRSSRSGSRPRCPGCSRRRSSSSRAWRPPSRPRSTWKVDARRSASW